MSGTSRISGVGLPAPISLRHRLSRLAAVWRNVAHPPTGDGHWIRLEHELWSFAVRDERARAHLARRYEAAWSALDDVVAEGLEADGAPVPGHAVGPALIGALLGLEMMRRIAPDAIDDDTAVATLRGVLGVPLPVKEPSP